MLQMLDRVEGVLKRLGYILLYILGTGSGIHRDDHERVGVDVWIEVNR